MSSLISYLLQMIAASGLLYGYYHFFLRNKQFHLYNRYYLLASAFIAVIVPFLNIPIYFTAEQASASPLLYSFVSTGYDVTVVAGEKASTGLTGTELLYTIYFTLCIVLIVRIAHSFIKLNRIRKNNPVERLDDILFINTGEPGTPFSFFRWLFWNKETTLDSDKGQQIFRHELFHIKQKHSIDVLFTELLTAIFWINPFFHLLKKELRTIHEFLADEAAVTKNEEWNYAELLLMQALHTKQFLVNPFFHNQIKRRIAMITLSKQPKYRYFRKIMVLPLIAIVAILFAFSYKQLPGADNPGEKNVQFIGQLAQPADTVPKPVKVVTGSKLKEEKIKEIPMVIPKGDMFTNSPLVVIDNKIQTGDVKIVLDKISPNSIKSITVIKDKSGIVKYGDAAKNGVIEIVTKIQDAVIVEGKPLGEIKEERIVADNNLKEVVVAGYATPKKVEGKPLGEIKEEKIVADNSLKEVVVAGYATPKKAEGEKIFSKVEEAPLFPGGQEGWQKYLVKNLNAAVPVEHGAPVGTYKVNIQFIVNEEGFISDLKPLTNHGYGMEEEVIRILKLGPKWLPAKQNGRIVKAYTQQPVTFVVTDDVQDEVTVPGFKMEKRITADVLDKLLSVYPNPANNTVTIPYKAIANDNCEIRVQDISGKVY
ncbi:MAG TPA: M56 family metallopeptidase, partial [Chitinophagaceae bacterium]